MVANDSLTAFQNKKKKIYIIYNINKILVSDVISITKMAKLGLELFFPSSLNYLIEVSHRFPRAKSKSIWTMALLEKKPAVI